METKQRPRWVLVIDDDPGVAVILREAIERAGFRVVFAQSVAEANAKLNKQVFDCVLTDMCLGKGTGEDVIDALRKNKGLNHRTPILVVSAFLDRDLVERVRTQVNGILVKPFNLATLLERICSVIAPAPVPVSAPTLRHAR